MVIGDTFDMVGYDEKGRVDCAESGEVFILNNNSTHFLVALKDGYKAPEQSLVTLLDWFYYGDLPEETGPTLAYARALLCAVSQAMKY